MQTPMLTLIFLSSIFSTLMAPPARALAGGISDGGGKSIVCRDSRKRITKAELLDLYEAANAPTPLKIDVGSPKQNYLSIASLVALRIARGAALHPSPAKDGNSEPSISLPERVNYVNQRVYILPPGVGLQPIDDSGGEIRPEFCNVEQVAAFNDTNDTLSIVRDIWSKFDNVNKAALLVHEALYERLRINGETTSARTRRAVGLGFANAAFVPIDDGLPNHAITCISDGSDAYRFTAVDLGSDKVQLQFQRIDGFTLLSKTVLTIPKDQSPLADPAKLHGDETKTGHAQLNSPIDDNPKVAFRTHRINDKFVDFSFATYTTSIGQLHRMLCGEGIPVQMKVTAVVGASGYYLPSDDSGQATGTPTIYGGVAGTYSTDANTTTIDTCADPANWQLKPCNWAAITRSTQLTISFTTKYGGWPVLLTPSGSQNNPLPLVNSAYAAPGSTASLTVTWGDLCASISSSFPDCLVTDSTHPSATFIVGVTPTANGVSPAESLNLNVVLAKIPPTGSGQSLGQSTTGPFASGEVGINEYEIISGKGEARLQINTTTGLTDRSHLPFRAVNLMWEEIKPGESLEEAFSRVQISSANNMWMTISTTSDGALFIEDPIIRGLQPNHRYAFRLALIDVAGNVGYFTDHTVDLNCAGTDHPESTTCHVGSPQ